MLGKRGVYADGVQVAKGASSPRRQKESRMKCIHRGRPRFVGFEMGSVQEGVVVAEFRSGGDW
jgi:hypothetical protein